MSDRHLLIVEDDPGLQSQMRWCVSECEVSTAADATETLAIVRRSPPQVVTLDLGLPPDPGGVSIGFELLEQIQVLSPRTKTIVITGREEKEHAIRAIGEGAYDYYQKPIDGDTLGFVIERAFRLWHLEAENLRLSELHENTAFDGLIAASSVMLDVCRTAERVAPTDASILILGGTGTGKELIAKAIHRMSTRSEGPFVAINCAAIPENLLESELFGHEKGAFTGAVGKKLGKIETAQGGTLFLDEIGDMPPTLQAKILRFLQDRRIEPVGSNTSIDVDVRIICATHRDLDQMIGANAFREDLYFRISELTLSVPRLSERGGDVLLIARSCLKRFAGGRNLSFTRDAQDAIERWAWPGNVRELENRVKRACIMAAGDKIVAADLELASADDKRTLPLNLKAARDDAERETITHALQRADGNVAQAARLLGVSRPTLYDLFEKHEIKAERGEN